MSSLEILKEVCALPLDKVSHRPGGPHLDYPDWPTRPRGSSVFASPSLEVKAHATMTGIFMWVLEMEGPDAVSQALF